MISLKKRNPEDQIMYVLALVLDLTREVSELRKMKASIVKDLDEIVDRKIESKDRMIAARLAQREAVKLRQLLVDKGIITQEEFEARLRDG
jgi:hypothetical protein